MRLLTSITGLLCLALAPAALAQEADYRDPDCCTSIMVSRGASSDGSVITSHTCDSWYRTWVNLTPAATYERDTVMNIYDGRLHTEWVDDQTGLKVKGQIPQARQTFAYLDTAYPCVNEKQLGMGETTITGHKELRNKQGMFYIEELQRIALQRCTTARDAIRLTPERRYVIKRGRVVASTTVQSKLAIF